MTALTVQAAARRAESSSSLTLSRIAAYDVSSISVGTSQADQRFLTMPPYSMFAAAGKSELAAWTGRRLGCDL
jgi:hypothetical protein